ncbi:hypothetical protein RhiirC2_790747 [Rhizophagus irregularis]|uniref:Uncharacterized protein n=1 Tax=Rhizophagus irregularis TaxID=588596 RepID=A0A2N1MG09_9GLOM|nr:hypothetical protein RhiirC2_793125 [Rhizophagus irregularis]PKK62176.1 hypothetical protein RhiirC2_790747 [Rhizophagus irregularis]
MSSNYEDNQLQGQKCPQLQGQKCPQLRIKMSSITRTEMSSNYEDNNDRNVLKYEDKSVLIVGQKSCPHSCEDKNVLKVARTKYTQFTRTTMALITRIKLSSSYKDRNVLKL